MLNKEIVDKLFLSFTELEQAINNAKATLSTKTDIPDDVFVRLNSYDDILFKQRSLASSLIYDLKQGDFEEARRKIGIINKLSQMIVSDVKDIVVLFNKEIEEEQETNKWN